MEVDDYRPLFRKAIKHYETRLRNLKKDSDIADSKLDILLENIETNANEIKKIADDFDNKIDHMQEITRKQICLSLSSYILDLEKMVSMVRSKAENLNIPFKDVEVEIKQAKEARDLLYPNGWSHTIK